MKRLFLVLGTAVVGFLGLAGARVQADMIQWSASASVETANPGPGGTAYVPAQLSPGDSVSPATIQMFPGGNTTGSNSGSVALTYLSAYDDGTLTGRIYKFGGASAQYQLSLVLHDQASGDSGTLAFHGFFNGQIPQIGSTLNPLTNTFVGPTTQTLKLGQNLYSVTLGPVVLPRETYYEENDTGGSISASINVQPVVTSTPEPSSLLLACLALPPLSLARWFRRRGRRRVVDSDTSKV